MASTPQTDRTYVGVKETLIFGVANGGQSFGYSLLTSYLTYFFINVFHVNPNYVSGMLFVEGIWDTINDPLMGTIIDRTRTRWGKLKPYLKIVPYPLAICTILLYAGPLLINNPSPNAISKYLFVTVVYFLWEFFYTIGDVPFWGMSAAISPNPDDRSRVITSGRLISNIFGAIPGILIPIMLDISRNSGMSMKVVFFILGLIAGTVGMGLFSLSGFGLKERAVQNSEEPTFRECIDQIIKNPPLRLIVLKEMLSAFANIGGIYSTYYYVDVLQNASASILTNVPSAIISLVAYVFVPIAKRYFNNKQLVIISPVFQSAVNAVTYFLGLRSYTNPKVMLPLLTINNTLPAFFNGINGVVPMEMIGETVDYVEWTTGQRSEGVSFSVPTFVSKFSGAISRSLGTATLGLVGYKTSSESAIVPQTDITKRNIWFMFMFSPVILRVIGVIPMFFYDLVGDKRQRMLDDLAERRERLSKEASGGDMDAVEF